MIKKLLFSFVTIALAVMSAASTHKINIFHDSQLGGKKLKAGEYRVQVKDDGIRLQQGKEVIEASGKVDTTGDKYQSTSIRYAVDTAEIQEIRVGGTNIKFVFSPGKMSAAN